MRPPYTYHNSSSIPAHYFYKLDCYHSKSLGDSEEFSLASDSDSNWFDQPLCCRLSFTTVRLQVQMYLCICGFLCAPVLSALWHENSLGQLGYAKAISIRSRHRRHVLPKFGDLGRMKRLPKVYSGSCFQARKELKSCSANIPINRF